MRRFLYLSAFLACWMSAASIAANAAAKLAACNDSGSCPNTSSSLGTAGGESGCRASVSGCNGQGQCASCTCQSMNCNCGCKTPVTTEQFSGEGCLLAGNVRGQMLLDADEDEDFTTPRCVVAEETEYVGFFDGTSPFEFVVCNTPFAGPGALDGFIGYVRESAPGDWKVVSTVEVDPEVRITFSNLGKPGTATDALTEVATRFGICVQVNDEWKTVVFHKC
jgi:hypothetical protein